jgi:hypothetical protein
MATINKNVVNNSIDNRSFALLRTNPKLTSNAKLLVNSVGDLFLSSFRANNELSKIEYQKYEVKSSGEFSIDIANFFKKTGLTEIYETIRTSSDVTVFSEYRFQYEDQYQYGAIQNTNKLYNEQYKIFAPIWLEKQVPSKFVIYRIDGTDYTNDYTEDTIGQNSRILELLKNATIIKTFDLGKSSNIGEYLNNHINNKRFPNSALTINFDEYSQSSFNGIDIINGGFVSKSEQINKDYIQVDNPEIFSNQTITNGFERNGIISANIINLEFLFDDATADNYKIYRYFGIYTDDIDEGYFGSVGLDSKGQLNINSSSYKTFFDLTGTSMEDIEMFPKTEQFQIPTIQYVKDKFGVFYNIKDSSLKIINPGNSDLNIPKLLSCKLLINPNNNSIDSFVGYSKNGKKLTAELKEPNYKGFVKITVKDIPNNNDRIFIGDITEIKISNYKLGDYLVIADPTILPAMSIDNRFSNQGSLQQIAIAIDSAINNGEIITYKTKVVDTSIIIEEIVAGNKRRQTAFGVYKNNLKDFIEINDGEFNNIGLINNNISIDWNIWTTISGSIEGQSILVKSSEIGNVQVGEYLKLKDSDKFVRIIEINQDPFDNNYFRVVLNGVSKIANDKVFEVYEEYKTIHGKFNAYDFKDFDFDFYSTRNSDLGDLIYDKYKNPDYTNEIETPLKDEFLSIDAQSFYAGLRNILSLETSNEISKTQLLNEYDRLNENSLKETALLSRVVPTICKYELKNSSNARNLPYILNVNEAFGDDNLSPNIELDSKRDIEYLNMEHFHLNNIPSNILGDRKNLNNYLDFADDGGLTLDKLKSTDFNYFDKHFNWTGYFDSTVSPSGKWFDNSYKRLWSKFDTGNFEKNSSTVFRGLRYVFQKRNKNIFLKGVDISEYKFGAYLSYNSSNEIKSNSVVFNCIKNDKFKFICVNIELNVIENNVTSDQLNRYLLYTLKDLTKTTDGVTQIVPIELPFNINFKDSVSSSDANAPFIVNAEDRNNQNFNSDSKFRKFIKKNSAGNYSWIYFEYSGVIYAVKVLDVIDDTSILISGLPYEFDESTGKINITTTPAGDEKEERLDKDALALIESTGPFYYYEGGENEFANLLDSISAYNYSKRFNLFGDINYITIPADGTIQVENDFVLSIESGIDVIKPSIVVSNDDPDRPKAFKISSNQIGNIIQDREDGGYATILRRMNGDYNPIFNQIVTFSDIYSDKKIIQIALTGKEDFYSIAYKVYNEKGISFESFKENTDNYGFINNYFYHKVNEVESKNVLKLSQTTDKLPLYPLIGEIAIDKKNINVFKSKYAKDYFTRSLSIGDFSLANGTLSPVENKAFMTSTIMKVKDSYDITSYTNTKEKSLEDLDKIRSTQSNITSVHWIENDSQITADFYLYSAILNKLIEDGIEEHFKIYIEPLESYGNTSSLNDDLQLYSKLNISNRFIIDLIKIYGIEGKGIETGFVSITEASKLTDDNFKELTNFNIQSYQNDSLSFRLIYNKKLGYSNNFKILIKIQA